jgi:dihydroneopterin aldolase
MTVTTTLQSMKFHAFHGVMAEERIIGGIFLVDLSYTINTDAVETDWIEDTIDYSLLFDLVKEEMMVSSNLIEHVAGRILNTLKVEFPQVREWVIRISKLNPPINGEMESASVTIKI